MFSKILKIIGSIVLLTIPTLRVWINYEDSICEYLYYLLVLVLFVLVVIKVFKNITNKKLNIWIFVFTFFIILDMVYYENFSIKAETILTIHQRYNIPYSEMKVVETKQANIPIGGGDYEPKTSLIKTGNMYISLYYQSKNMSKEQKWVDDYLISKMIAGTLSEFTNEYKYYNLYYDENYYVIVIKENDSYNKDKVVNKLNDITKYYEDFAFDLSVVNNI